MLVTVAAETERDYRNGPKGQSDPSIVLISYPQKGALISCDIEMESVKEKQLSFSYGGRNTEGCIGRNKNIESLN